jgi:hypothetical protein
MDEDVRVVSCYEAGRDGFWIHRYLESLKKERTKHRNRIKGLLTQQGIRVSNPSQKKFLEVLEKLRTWNGQAVLPGLKC